MSIEPLRIREITEEDAPELIKIIPELYAETSYMLKEVGDFALDESKERAQIRAWLQDSASYHLIAQYDGVIVGSLGFTRGQWKRTRHLGEFGIGIIEPYWGMGIGTALMEEFLAWCREKEITKVNLQVAEHNVRALSLYQKFGFYIEGKILRAAKLKDGYRDDLIMGKLL